MILSHGMVRLSDIKNQLKVVYRTCRQLGNKHPRCKAEYEVLDVLTEQYSQQMISLRKHITTVYHVEQEEKIHDDKEP